MSASDPAKAICLLGPTASGKTGLAVALAQRFPVDIISVDSVMVYRGMDIGSAKPDAATLALAPHRLIDILDPAEAYSAARFRHDAGRHIERILARGRVPLLVGGTLLYFRALQYGLSPLPAADQALRDQLWEQLESKGSAALHRRLQRLDPRAAARIHPHDPQRMLRALEVHALSGQALSDLQNDRLPEENISFFNIILFPEDRRRLHSKIAERLEDMFQQGLIAEVERLFRRPDLGPHRPALRALGYRQVWQYLDGESDYAAMRQQVLSATRQFAKRQLTWLRHQSLRGPCLRLDSDRADVLDRTVTALAETIFCRI